MKRLYTLILVLSTVTALQAQTYMRLWRGGESTRMTLSEVGDMTFLGQSVDIKGTNYALAEIDSLVIMPQITVNWKGGMATVNVPATIKDDIEVSTLAGHVTITNKNVWNEIELTLSGDCNNGSLTYEGAFKSTIRLNGLNLTSKSGAALNIQNGKRIDLVLTNGTVNSLTDAAAGTHKAALYCRGHLEVEGGGSLTVKGNTGHAIASKEYMLLKKSTGTITVSGSVKDAIHCSQYFEMRGGTVTWDENMKGDGIQAELDLMADDITPEPDPENTGNLTITGGTVTGVMTAETGDGIKCDGLMTISGGTIDLQATGTGCRGIKADMGLTVSEDTSPTAITIVASGAEWINPADPNDTTKSTCIRVKGQMTVNAGTISVTYAKGCRGIKADVYTKNGGTVINNGTAS